MSKVKFNETAMASSEVQDWCTPKEVFDLVREIAPIRLDVCTNSNNPAKADQFYTPHDDGLVKSWMPFEPGVIWCNPPYKYAAKWVQKAGEEAQRIATSPVGAGTGIIMLIPARPDTKYWHDNIFTTASKICFIKGRLKFVDPVTSTPHKDAAPFPTALILWSSCSEIVSRFEYVTNNAGYKTISLTK